MPNNLTGFENSILESWESWDGDMQLIQFNDAKLKIDTKKFLAGDTVDCIAFNFENCTVQILKGEDGTVIEEFKFKLVPEFQA